MQFESGIRQTLSTGGNASRGIAGRMLTLACPSLPYILELCVVADNSWNLLYAFFLPALPFPLYNPTFPAPQDRVETFFARFEYMMGFLLSVWNRKPV
jgi:hypothetical protein